MLCILALRDSQHSSRIPFLNTHTVFVRLVIEKSAAAAEQTTFELQSRALVVMAAPNIDGLKQSIIEQLAQEEKICLNPAALRIFAVPADVNTVATVCEDPDDEDALQITLVNQAQPICLKKVSKRRTPQPQDNFLVVITGSL